MKYFNRSVPLAALYLTLSLGLPAIAVAQQPSTQHLTMIETVRLSSAGRALSADEANNLEKTLEADPKNVAARVSLIAYYATRHDEPFKSKKVDQALWFIRNLPDAEILQWIIQVRLNPVLDKGYAEAKQLWLDNLSKYKGNTTVIANAASFFMITEMPLAEKLLKDAAALEPTNPKWPADLGHLIELEMQSATGETRHVLAARAYEQYSLAYGITTGAGKSSILGRLPVAAFEAGDLKQAREWALEILNQAASNQTQTLVDAVHHAQIVLGRFAIVNGDLQEAKQRLMLAGQTKGSPAMKSFGPNMSLAKELLEKGERETVVKYFDECAAFWTHDQGKLAQWTAQVKAGETPQFGANLVY
jgi:hypothetical protein